MKKYTTYALILFTGVILGLVAYGATQKNTQTLPPSSNATQTDSNGTKTLTLQDVATHTSANDCYLAINKKVYDVSNYINKHPGGKRNITSRCGQEVTGIFASIHSNFAWNLLAQFYIADIGTSQASVSSASSPNTIQASLDDIKQKVEAAFPDAEVISVKPKNDFYLAVIQNGGQLTEVHLDAVGKVTSTEVQNAEFDWNSWDSDQDDN